MAAPGCVSHPSQGPWQPPSASPVRNRGRFLPAALAVVLLALPGAPAQSGPNPLPPKDQKLVNKAIDRGVHFLKLTQTRFGTWTLDKDNHPVAYAALPALTLLECGEDSQDIQIQGAARFVRRNYIGLIRTYDISLAILFLDRLGDKKDRKIIHTLALRLIAGQSATGGWTYRCPILKTRQQQELYSILRKLSPKPRDPLPPSRTEVKDRGKLPPSATDKKDPDKLPPSDTEKDRGKLPPPDAEKKDPGKLPPSNLEQDPGKPSSSSTAEGEKGPADNSRLTGPVSRRWHWCIKMGEGSGAEAVVEKEKPATVKKPTPPPRVSIPPDLRLVPVLQDPRFHILADPENKLQIPAYGTTDNSNTQFAMLALWAARRHGIPMERSLQLMVRRYHTSQNGDGTWNYRYLYGGTPQRSNSTPAMTAVGLIGLAVGHGLASDGKRTGQPVQDLRVLRGFVALTNDIGEPVGRMDNLPMQNLYFLWTVERVGVLYDLATIGKKDWYRWGAEVLVANQKGDGFWTGGGYHKADPIVDTCLALLFLKKANFAKDLTAKLPFDPNALSKDIEKKLAPTPTDKPVEPKQPGPSKIVNPEKAPAKEIQPSPQDSGPPGSQVVQAAEGDKAEDGGSGTGILILGSLGLLCLLGLAAVLYFANRGQQEEKEPGGKPRRSSSRSDDDADDWEEDRPRRKRVSRYHRD